MNNDVQHKVTVYLSSVPKLNLAETVDIEVILSRKIAKIFFLILCREEKKQQDCFC